MKSKRHNGMRRRNGNTPAAEPLESRRMLTVLPLPAGSPQPRILENGTGSSWTIQNRNGTSNGLPVGGSRNLSGGLGVFSASYDTAHNHPFDFGHSIWVNDSIFVAPGGDVDPRGQADVTGYVDDNGIDHWTRLSAGPAAMSGLDVGVEYYAARQSATLRTLARFDNPGDAAVSANVVFVYNLGSDANTKITGTSNGDFSFTTADRWIVTDDIPPTTGDAVPAVTAVLRGPGSSALAPSTVSNVVYSAAGTEGVLARYDITVPAHETRYLMFFTQLSLTSADGLDGARAFDVAPTAARTPFWGDLLAGVDDAQYRQILNWASNTPPVANADAFVTDEDTPLEATAPGVLGNDTDADGDAINAVLETGPGHGTLDLRPDGSFTYTPDKDHFGTGAAADSFTYRARDTFGALSEPATVTIDVNPVNDAPVAEAGADATADEGAVVSFAGSGSDVDDAAGSLTYHWDFGDDSSAEGASATHAYADNGTYTAVLTVTDPSGASASDELTVTVANVAPAATITGAPDDVIAEGAPVNLAAHVVDPGSADTLAFQWTVSRGGAVLAAGTDATFAYTPADEGEYVFALAVTDDDGGVGTDTLTIVVANAAPTLDGVALSPATVDEGGTTRLSGRVGDVGAGDVLTLSVDWADGSAADVLTLAPGDAFDVAHVYLDDQPGAAPDTYAVSVSLADGDGGAAAASAPAAVNNAAPVVGAVTGSATATPGQNLGFGVPFADAGLLDTHTATIDWGDDGGAAPVALAEPAGSNAGSVSANHAYEAPGVYTITFAVRDDDGGEGRSTAVVTVAEVVAKPAELRPDPLNPGKTALYVTGTGGGDTIVLATAGRDLAAALSAILGQSGVSGAAEALRRTYVLMNGVLLGGFSPTGRVIVDGGAGDDSVHVIGDAPQVWVYGGTGDDDLNLGNGGGFAFGGSGNDHILGGGGRDVLVGGDGADRIVGNAGDDIIISAVTRFDNRSMPASHDVPWAAIYAEWTNPAHTFVQRVDNLRDGTGNPAAERLNGSFFLNDDTVDDDTSPDAIGTQDVLTGSAGQDWLIYKFGEDKVTGMSSTEASEDLTIT